MSELYKSSSDLIGLFTYEQETDYERNTHSWRTVCIDKTNGNIIHSRFVNLDPMCMRAGCISVFEQQIDYEWLKSIVKNQEIETKKTFIYPLEQLNEQNWKQWLKDNGFI